MSHSSSQAQSAPRKEPGTAGFFLSDAELAARTAAAESPGGRAPQQASAATPAELLKLQQQYAALSNLEREVGNQQRRWHWVWGLILVLVLAAAAALLAFSSMERAPAPSTEDKPANGGVTNEELPLTAVAAIGSDGAASMAAKTGPELRSQPVAPAPIGIGAATGGVAAVPAGAAPLSTGPASGMKTGRSQAHPSPVRRPAVDEIRPATSCSAAALALALCDVKSR